MHDQTTQEARQQPAANPSWPALFLGSGRQMQRVARIVSDAAFERTQATCAPCGQAQHDLCLSAIDAFDPPARYPDCRCRTCYPEETE
jgi:hypothetical protein